MGTSAGPPEPAPVIERAEATRLWGREVKDRARRMRIRALELRQRSEQMRSATAGSLSRCRQVNAAFRTARAAASAHGGGAPGRGCGAPAAQWAALVAFVHARLDEEATAADLHHEAPCPTLGGPGRDGVTVCGCRAPAHVRYDVSVRRGIVRDIERALRAADHSTPNWPYSELSALVRLKTSALPHELHKQWREAWRP
ncbi:DUF6221 family protein [Streptomyces tsukubensis]|uniref:Uncharacterized protein n=1 Tax=Streptomyces tsukubensis TaxID=83656 RepID=A0A1V4A3H6_9ACTN|nr:DUF6221 family protein [Streptomyces tsukubensis]OON73860.1 hypothetical protein B1H18_26755 [Streptomyces tsukubensis]QFR91768.1 hypothetical protein GBW32_00265 [Streptomyces tsukubensis]